MVSHTFTFMVVSIVGLITGLSRWHRVGHVNFMLFVSFSFAVGSQGKRGFWWTNWAYEID